MAGNSVEENQITLEGLAVVAEQAAPYSEWSIMMVGASLLALISTSYSKPQVRFLRSYYFLFIPAWFFLGQSIYYGDLVRRGYIAASLMSENTYFGVHEAMNANFIEQISALRYGVAFLSFWLLLYIVWFVFGDDSAKSGNGK